MPITYPIQDSDRFTVYDTNTGQPLKDGSGKAMTNQKWGSKDKSKMIEGLADNIKWLIEVREPQGSYDAATQKATRLPINYDVANETATIESWQISDLTQEEIDAKIPPHFEYNSNGIKLAVQEKDQAAFGNLLLLVNESGMASTDMLMLTDCLGAKHGVTVAQFKEMIVPYGLHCYALFNAEPEQPSDDPML